MSFDELLAKHKQEQQQRQKSVTPNGCRNESPTHDAISATRDVLAVGKKKKTRLVRKSFFPLFTKAEAANSSRAGEDCLRILDAAGEKTETAGDPVVESLCSGVSALHVEQKTKETSGNYPHWLTSPDRAIRYTYSLFYVSNQTHTDSPLRLNFFG